MLLKLAALIIFFLEVNVFELTSYELDRAVDFFVGARIVLVVVFCQRCFLNDHLIFFDSVGSILLSLVQKWTNISILAFLVLADFSFIDQRVEYFFEVVVREFAVVLTPEVGSLNVLANLLIIIKSLGTSVWY